MCEITLLNICTLFAPLPHETRANRKARITARMVVPVGPESVVLHGVYSRGACANLDILVADAKTLVSGYILGDTQSMTGF